MAPAPDGADADRVDPDRVDSAGRWFTDHPPSTRFPHYTRANAGEVLPTPASPLGQTYGFDAAILPGFQRGSTRTGMYEAADYRVGVPEMCGFFGGYFYINLSCIRMQAVRNPAITVEDLDRAFFGEQPDTPPYTAHPDDVKPHLQPLADAHMQFVLTTTDWPELLEERERAAIIRDERPDLPAVTDAELLARVRALQPEIERLGEHQLVAASSSGIAPAMLAAVAAALEEPSLPIRLLAGLGDVDSAAPSFALWDLSRQVRASTELTAIFDQGVVTALERIAASRTEDARAFEDAWARFVHEFGSRGPNEWELSAHTWETDPTIALAALDRVRHQTDDRNPRLTGARLAAERAALVDDVRGRLAALGNPDLTGVFEGALVGGNMMVFRERAKTTLVRVLHEARMVFRELGRRHCADGHLDDPEHVFMLTDGELDAFVADPGPWRTVLAQRAADWARLWALEPPFFIRDGLVPPLGQWAQRTSAGRHTAAVAGEVLTGVAGSAGVVTGRARIVTDPANPPDLQPGDVMIAPLTDPAWTPLFLAVDAVVVDVGGQISHAVIVSRELGLPCAVSVTGASLRIPDGATVRVDGGLGEVRVLDVP